MSEGSAQMSVPPVLISVPTALIRARFGLRAGFLRFQDTTNKTLQSIQECRTAQGPAGTAVGTQGAKLRFR